MRFRGSGSGGAVFFEELGTVTKPYTGLWVALGMANSNTYLTPPLQVSPQINQWVQPCILY